ncbi:HPP family protein [Pseudoduganella danionis]|uniref:CBS domain-containing protein n=1 Tax=Pseudoduganella danionis TaxID=1890295 RepID=A0ABW9SU25_9BURK|nr:HPP family protein [Pseudoduganella danionis]MTW35355.1 CBS domain-containing protein [Pseudoduganella danionis]
MRALLQRWLPGPATTNLREQLRGAAGMLLGLFIGALLCQQLLATSQLHISLIAPMGATAVLLFALPASPLAQPWSVIGGNVVSALVGVACVHWLGASLNPALLGALAAALALTAMFALRCLHPPGGAVALITVIGGPAVQAAGYHFAMLTVLANSAMMVLLAILYNNLTGRSYPHTQQAHIANLHATKDEVPTVRLGFKPDDLDAVLRQYNQVLDISRDDLHALFMQTEQRAYQRRFGMLTCGDIMSRDIVSAEFGSCLEDAWRVMREHRLAALPVLNRADRVIGIITLADFLEYGGLNDIHGLNHQLKKFLRKSGITHTEKAEVVGQIMCKQATTVHIDTPIADLVPLMADSGLHHIPVIDHEQRFAGMVAQSDLIAALYERRLAEAVA